MDSFSRIEVKGKVEGCSSPEDLSSKEYFYIRLSFKDEGSPYKNINIYFWEDKKFLPLELNVSDGDIVVVRGELSCQKKVIGENKFNIFSIRGHYIEKMEEKPLLGF